MMKMGSWKSGLGAKGKVNWGTMAITAKNVSARALESKTIAKEDLAAPTEGVPRGVPEGRSLRMSL